MHFGTSALVFKFMLGRVIAPRQQYKVQGGEPRRHTLTVRVQGQ